MKIEKMNKYFLIIILVACFSCTEGFKEINTNPNSPVEVQPDLLLRQVIYDYGDEMAYEGFVAGNLLGQYFTAIDFNLFDRHSLSEPQFGGNPWPTLYKNLRDNEIILEQARTTPALAVYEGPSLILKAYLTAALTDIYGDVPYSEALQGDEGLVTPRYDPQAQVYNGENGILDNLRKGIAAIQNYEGAAILDGDIIYGGDLDKWIKFGNSLLIKSLMRISERQDVSPELQQVFNEGNYIRSNAENAVFGFADSQPNNFRMANLRSGDFNLFILSETMEEVLKDLNDPRLPIFFRPAANSGNFAGLLNGPDASQTSISVADFSLAGEIFRENPGSLNANFITAWETAFFLAEAAERGLIFGNAQQLYESAVTMAFEFWNAELPTAYLVDGPAAFGQNGANKIEQILTQKWIANIINGYEGWVDYRRTSFPNLKTISASLNNNLIPARMPYPADEEALNQENFNAVGNDINQRVWWDVD
ncbi:MAG: SusD/RagB family nutrient-binding outer membrane lipoprotein [Bacteroidota bacterium]